MRLLAFRDFLSQHVDARKVGRLTPALQVTDVVQKTSGVGEIAGRPSVDRLLLTVVEAGRAVLEVAGAAETDGVEHREPLLLGGLLRLDLDDPLFDAGLDDVRHVLGRLGEEVREVRAEPPLARSEATRAGNRSR